MSPLLSFGYEKKGVYYTDTEGAREEWKKDRDIDRIASIPEPKG
jgi:hypothetical protein